MLVDNTHRGMSPGQRLALHGLFLASGGCGLLYEIVWTRKFVVVAGGNTRALAAVIAAYMCGLALGSLLGGRLADRRVSRPVFVYGILEASIALSALAVTYSIDLMVPLLQLGKSLFKDQPLGFDLFRFALCALAMAVPATLMGSTLPVLLRGLALTKTRVGLRAGSLYATNTSGAVVGALLAGFVTIPALGLDATVLAAAGMNMLIFAAAVLGPFRDLRAEVRPPKRSAATQRDPVVYVLLAGYGLSGLCAMIYQVTWIRALTLSLGSVTYTVSLVVASFILGLALGGALLAPLADRFKNPLFAAGLLEAAIGFTALLGLPSFESLTVYMFEIIPSFQHRQTSLQLVRFALSFLLVLGPTLCMGGLFPLAVRIAETGAQGIARPAGNVLAANTLGAVAGAALAGHVFIRLLGVHNSIAAAAVVCIAVGIGWILLSGPRRPLQAASAIAAAIFAAVAVSSVSGWDPFVMNSGPYFYARAMWRDDGTGKDTIAFLRGHYDLLFYREGIETTVAVLRDRESGEMTLRLDGKSDASTLSDMPTQVLFAHVPLSVHPRPRKVMILGLASGVTAGSVLAHPEVGELDCFEISPAVARAAGYFAAASNLDLSDPRFHLVIDDARNHLLVTDKLYDVIIVEPSNPRVAGMSMLYTAEFYKLLASRLEPGGIVLGFLPIYDMDVVAARMVMRSFAEAFPYPQLWESLPSSDYFMIGGMQEPAVDYERALQSVSTPRVAADLARIHIKRPEQIFARFVLSGERFREAAGTGILHTDDRLQLEYSSPRLEIGYSPERIDAIAGSILSMHHTAARLFSSVPADAARTIQGYDFARERFYRALASSRPDMAGSAELGRALEAWQRAYDESEDSFFDYYAAKSLQMLLVNKARADMSSGRPAEAVAALERAYNIEGESPTAAAMLASYYLKLGHDDLARLWAGRALERAPTDPYALSVIAKTGLAAAQK